MMGRFLQNLCRIFLVLLLATIGAGSAGTAPAKWSQTELSILQQSILTGNTDPTNAAPTDLTRALALSRNLLHWPATGTDRVVPPSSEGHNYQGPVANGHWVDAANMKAGYRLLNSDETWAEVVSVKIEKKALKAYNLTVADFHTYFVRGADNDNSQPIWVHNNCWDSLPDGSKSTSRTTPDGRTICEGPNGEEIYKGNDNSFYDAKVHAPNRTVKPILVDQGLARTTDIRSGLTVGNNRTVAYSEVEVSGLSGNVVGVSGLANRGSPYNGATIAGNTTRTGPGRQDAEVKILDHLRSQLTPESSGTIRLFVDQPAARGVCQHCTTAILDFRRDFPNIRLDVSAN